MNIRLIDADAYEKSIFGDSFPFLVQNGLIEFKYVSNNYKVKFVGEVTTPFGQFIALPKNFEDTSQENIQLVKRILKEYKNVKQNGKLLIANKSYQTGHEIESPFIYWKKLYTYFMDYITYGFFYPKKRSIKHSVKRENGIINTLLTDVNRSRLGSGITYEVKDRKVNDFSTVYYSTLKDLEREFASEQESLKIKEMESFLQKKGFELTYILVDGNDFLSKARKMDVSAIHETILTTLIDFYKNTKIKEKNKINVFYTLEFEYLCEYLIQKALKHNADNKTKNWLNPNYKSLNPDILTNDFIGDVKYYKISEIDRASFDKELYAHSIANGNLLPNFVFIPSEKTEFLTTREHHEYKLKIVTLNLHDVVNDCFKQQNSILNEIKKM